jgi:ABC-type Co2+ transport system permease subunit
MESCTTLAAFRIKGRFPLSAEGLCAGCASWCGWLLRRIMRRFFTRMQIYCAGFCAALVVLLCLVIEGVAD